MSEQSRPKSAWSHRKSRAFDFIDVDPFPETPARPRSMWSKRGSRAFDASEMQAQLESFRDPEDFAWRRRYRQSLNDIDLAEKFAQYMSPDVSESFLEHNKTEFEAVIDSRPHVEEDDVFEVSPTSSEMGSTPFDTTTSRAMESDVLGLPVPPYVSDDLDYLRRSSKGSRFSRLSKSSSMRSVFRPMRSAFRFMRRRR